MAPFTCVVRIHSVDTNLADRASRAIEIRGREFEWPRYRLYGPQGAGPTPPSATMPSEGPRVIPAKAAIELVRNNAIPLDIRGKEEYAREHIPGAVLIPSGELREARPAFKASDQIVAYCQIGKRSSTYAEEIGDAAEPASVVIVDGGLNAWKAAGGPTSLDTSQPIPIVRQAQIATGALVILGVVLSLLGHHAFIALSAATGFALILSGITGWGWGGVVGALYQLPWNRHAAGYGSAAAPRPLPIPRQAQLTAGTLIATGAVLSRVRDPAFIYLSAFLGSGLIVTGLTSWCGIADVLSLIPFNKNAAGRSFQRSPSSHKTSRLLPIPRQAQVVAGSLVVTGAVLSQTRDPRFAYLSAFLGSGLALTGATGWCGIADILSLLPFNQSADRQTAELARPLPILRQVQLLAGLLVVAGVSLSRKVHPAFVYLSGFIGSGLVFAGTTGWCGMAIGLSHLPYNKNVDL